jgi:hypothetical protein
VRLTFDRLWIWIAIALPALVALLVPLPAVDLAYQVRAGNEILTTGAVPRMDTWTFTVAGTPWLDQQWLAQVVLALGHRVGGWELLAVLRAGLVAASVGMLVAVAMERGASARTASILALVAFALAAPALALRPQLLGILLFAVLLWLVAARLRHPRAYLLAPVVVVLWANVHGSFVLGPALLGYAWVSDVVARRPARQTLWILIAGTAATLLNPYLAGVWLYAAGIGANPAIAGQVSEWQRTSPLEMPGILFYPSVMLTVALLVRRHDRVTVPDWILTAAMAFMGAWAVRGVAWWAFAMVFLLAGILAEERVPARERGPAPASEPAPPHDAQAEDAGTWSAEAMASRRARRASRLNGATAALLGVLILAALPWWRPVDPLTGRMGLLSYAPTGLAAAVAALPDDIDRVLVPQTWGSWFEWAAPEATYFIDSRFELFPPDVWDDYRVIGGGGDDARAVLDRWDVEAIVMTHGRPTLWAGWTQISADADGALFVRDR